MTWHEAIEGWRTWMRSAGRPQSTIGLRLYQLRRFAEDHQNPWSVSERQLVTWLAGHDWSVETRRSYRSALRSFYAWGHRQGLTTTDPTRDLPPIRPTDPKPRPAPEEVVINALGVADVRVQLMLLLAAQQGLRRGEISRVHSRDLTRDLAGWSLRVHGKGNKERVVPLTDTVARRLRELEPGWAFPGRIDGHLSPRWIGTLVGRAMEEGWTTHTLRHRFATAAYRGTRDLLSVQQLLGHSRPETTQRYVQLPDDAMRAALRHVA